MADGSPSTSAAPTVVALSSVRGGAVPAGSVATSGAPALVPAPPVRKNLWLIRHAESMSNVAANYPAMKEADFVNTRLSENGRTQQAPLVKGSIDLLIVSPLRRTMETYAHSNLRVKRLFTSELVREWRAYGCAGDFELEAPRAESADELRARVERTLELLRAQPETNIGILSHGVFLAELAARIGNRLSFGMANAQVVHIPNAAL
jgi:broad specificity phosphatase PhoE